MALSHPARRAVLRVMMRTNSRVSPKELSERIHMSLNGLSYHVRLLAKFEAIRPAGDEPVRGATKHYYALGRLVKENRAAVELLMASYDGPEEDEDHLSSPTG
jgi:DNA-binding transcriptional ArsR family regulator